MSTTPAVTELTFGQLKDVTGGLRGLVDKLDALLAGEDDAWTAEDALRGHQLLVLAQSHAAGVRALRSAEHRRRTVVPLAPRR